MQFRILVTSSKGGVGKSTTSLLLALSLAKRGKRVLLCDCDIGSRCLDMLLGIEDEVTSPTYAYMNDYDGGLFHYDCYRIESPRQAENLGLADYFEMGGVCLVEWSENIAPLLPGRAKRVIIRKTGEEEREIEY